MPDRIARRHGRLAVHGLPPRRRALGSRAPAQATVSSWVLLGVAGLGALAALALFPLVIR